MKTFYAKTMAEALRKVKSELGHDALLLSTKESQNRSGVGGRVSGYEVVAAIEAPDEQDLVSLHHAAQSRAVAEVPASIETMPAQGAETESPIYTRASIRHTAAGTPAGGMRSTKASAGVGRRHTKEAPVPESVPALPDSTSAALYSDLVSNGVQDWLARKLLVDGQRYLAPKQRRTRASLLRSVVRAAETLIAGSPSEDGMPGKRVVVFVGPTGVGKTTSIAKLAARLALQKRKKIVLMTLDGFRIGAVEQLRTYAGLMGIPFRFVNDIADLPKAIKEQRQRDFILIDTAGRTPRDLKALKELAGFLNSVSDIERHLVLSATTKASDLKEIVERFEICRPDRLLFTKVDETSSLGSILNELVRSGKALSYYSDGQRVPEDLHAAPKEQIVDMVLNKI